MNGEAAPPCASVTRDYPWRIHRNTCGRLARWPFIRIPTRKMRPATHAAPRTKTPSSTSDVSHCHTGTEVA